MGDAEDAFTAGNEEFVKENWRAALEHFSAAVELDGSKTEYHLHKAAALCKLGSYSEAVAVCDQVIGREGGNAKAYLRKGMALVGCGDLSAARGALEAGQALDASNRSFATWLKKCGDAPAPGPESGGGAPGNVGKHDTELEGLLAAHGAQGYAVMETVVEFLARRTSMLSLSSAPEMLASLASKYSSSTCNSHPSVAAPTSVRQAVSAGTLAPHGTGPPAGAQREMREMSVVVSPSAKKAWEKAVAERSSAMDESLASDPNYIAVGTQCKNNGCSRCYEDASSLERPCMYHPGAPVFHEGYKFWSCCKKKKTTEFSEFMSFPGCTQGVCVFKEDPTKKKKALCRYDFFQVGSAVTLSIYAKKVDPDACKVSIGPRRLSLSILFDFVNQFTLDVDLSGVVIPEQCKVEVLAPKVEITLKKGDGSAWSELGALLGGDVNE